MCQMIWILTNIKLFVFDWLAAMGYSSTTIKKSFGDLVYGEDDKNELKELLNELNIKDNNKKTKK